MSVNVAEACVCAIGPGMAFIVYADPATRETFLVESYRDAHRKTSSTLCYLGREQDGTDTLAEATWEQVMQRP